MTNNNFKKYLEITLDSPEDPAGELMEIFNNFTKLNWEELIKFWEQANPKTKENIPISFYGCTKNEGLINFVNSILQSHPEIDAEDYFLTIQNKTSEIDTKSYLKLSKSIWDKYPSKRKRIKHSIWRTGNSNKFLKEYSFSNWKEAGL